MQAMRIIEAAILGLALGATGCVSTSIGADLARVRELSRAPIADGIVTSDVDPASAKDLAALLRDPLTADTAVRVALTQNRELRAQLRELGVARGLYVQAGLLPNPAFRFDVRRPADRTQPLQTDFEVEYDLTHAILAPLRSSAARADLEAARYRSAGAVIELGFNVRAGFYAFQAAQQKLAIAVRTLDALAAGRDAARALFKAGNIPELDLVTQEAAYERARATAAEIELDVLDRRERMQRLLGLHGKDTAWTAAAALPAAGASDGAPQDLERIVIKASLDLAEAKSRIEATARRVGLARTEGLLPEISIDMHAEQDGRSFEIGGGARVTLPFFDRRQGTVLARQSELGAQIERYHGAAIDLRSSAREAKNRVRSAHMRAKQYEDVIVPARRRVVEQSVLQYNAMQIGVFQLLQARREELDAELAYVETLRELATARAALDALVAGRRVSSPSNSPPSGMMSGGNDNGGGH